MQALIDAIRNDPDLATVDQALAPSVVQMLYISTGCDFISFFNGLGKASFFATLFEYCGFFARTRLMLQVYWQTFQMASCLFSELLQEAQGSVITIVSHPNNTVQLTLD